MKTPVLKVVDLHHLVSSLNTKTAKRNTSVTITGTFTGNNNSDGPFVYTGCLPGRIQYGSVDVLYQNRVSQNTVDFLTNGFKVRTTSNGNGSVNYTVTTTHTGVAYNANKYQLRMVQTVFN